MPKYFSILILSLFFCTATQAQLKDTMAVKADSIALAKANHKKIYSSPRRATIMSAILPGLGQVYNRKYWKVPIIYVGLGGFAYMFSFNNALYKDYKKDVIAYYDSDPATVAVHPYSGDALQTQKLYYRKYRDFAIIGMGVVYLINLIDANVDAHLKTFDVSDDLSLQLEPWMQPQNTGFGMATGVTLKLNFKK
ncbi:MAG: hypothetical protein IT236_07720 [Bacteroidia bacterium]|nr:hypothetical protein [Bacteroidia bacterium]